MSRRQFKIGFRTIKTAVGAVLAITLAHFFGLEHYTSAGILTILCIQKTKKSSFLNSMARFSSCIIGILFSILFFQVLGYHPLALVVLLLFFIPTTVLLHIKEGIATSAVIIFHMYIYEAISTEVIVNEMGIITIGIGVALLTNLYMPNLEKELGIYQGRLEQNYKKILSKFVLYLRNGDNFWDGKEITETYDLLQKAQSIAYHNIENHFLRYEDRYYHYFKMREKQFEILLDLMPVISSLQHPITQSLHIADFLEELSAGVHPGNTANLFLEKLDQLRNHLREMPLPQTREEFEIRAQLFYLLNEIEAYLKIKQQFKVREQS